VVYKFLKEDEENKIKIFGNNFLDAGECLNIYGDQYVGKTTLCFYIIKNNPNKNVVYVASEVLDPLYRTKLRELTNNKVYILDCFNVESLVKIIEEVPTDIVIVDSLTAMNYITNKKDLEKLFDVINKKRIHLILVSQIRSFDGKEYYEHKKILDFFSFKTKVEKKLDWIVLDNKEKIPFSDVWC